MQIITITGYLSKDAEGTTVNGDPVTRWNVPVKQGWGDREQTNWFRVSIWGKRADFAAKAVKGEFVTVTGELSIGEYNGKPQYDIRANDFTSVTTAPRDSRPQNQTRQPEPAGCGSNRFATDLDDDIPY